MKITDSFARDSSGVVANDRVQKRWGKGGCEVYGKAGRASRSASSPTLLAAASKLLARPAAWIGAKEAPGSGTGGITAGSVCEERPAFDAGGLATVETPAATARRARASNEEPGTPGQAEIGGRNIVLKRQSTFERTRPL